MPAIWQRIAGAEVKMVPSIEELRGQCRIDDDDDSDDLLLSVYVAAAKNKAKNFLNRSLYEDTVPESDADGLLISADIKLALMLMVGHWYENREETSDTEKMSIPFGFTALIEPYRFIPL